MRSLPIRWRWLFLALVTSLAAGCGGSSSAAGSATSTGPAVFRLIKANGSTVPFSLGRLRKLPLVSIMSHGQPQEGPAVLAVLHDAGVTSFGSIKVTGGNGSKTLTQAEVTKDVILDFNDRGSVKLVSPAWAKPQRIIDVVRIEVTS